MFGSLAFPAGIILFPIAYLFGDILTEVYGYSASRKVIWTGFASLILMVVAFEVAIMLKPAPFWQYQSDFEHILGHVPRIVVASIVAYFLGEFSNSFVLAKMKVKQGGKSMALRFIASTFCGELVDTTVFVFVAFIGVMKAGELFGIILSAWLFKVCWEIIALPISIPLVRFLKKRENEDHFDDKTNFNPFTLKE